LLGVRRGGVLSWVVFWGGYVLCVCACGAGWWLGCGRRGFWGWGGERKGCFTRVWGVGMFVDTVGVGWAGGAMVEGGCGGGGCGCWDGRLGSVAMGCGGRVCWRVCAVAEMWMMRENVVPVWVVVSGIIMGVEERLVVRWRAGSGVALGRKVVCVWSCVLCCVHIKVRDCNGRRDYDIASGTETGKRRMRFIT